MEDAATPPAWVRKRDGRLEPFDADKISRALFAASESLGRPDAFLARELADGVVHFLAAEAESETPQTAQVAELVEKVVRELGQPALAAAFTEHGVRRVRNGRPIADAPRAAGELVLRFAAGTPPDEVLSACVRGYTLQTVFARDLVAAHNDGLLTLTGLDAPGELAGCVLGPPGEDGLLAAVEKARRFTGGLLVLDGPEYLPCFHGPDGERRIADFARNLSLALRLARLDAAANLNCAVPPSWAGDLAEGPLFADRPSPAPDRLARLADALLAECLRREVEVGRVRIDWHLSEADFRPEAADRLTAAARPASTGSPIGFVFDRPRRSVRLAAGVDRRHPAALLTVGLNLPRLAEQPGVRRDPSQFLKKLGSLARLALSAAVQKRDYLRRREAIPGAPEVTSGFLLDRARLVAAPFGLDAVVRRFTGRGLITGGAALDLGKRVVQTLREVLKLDGGRTQLAACLDGPDDFHLVDALTVARAAGPKPWDAAAPMKHQLRAAGALHAVAEGGTEALFLPQDSPLTAEAIVHWLRLAWKQGDVGRIQFVQAG